MVGVLVAAAVSWAWSALAVRVGPALGVVDLPDDPTLKAHDRPAVPLGGVGVFAGFHLGLLAAGQPLDPGLLLATSIVVVLGLVDDRVDLSPLLRLAAEVGAGVVLVSMGDLPLDASSPFEAVFGGVLVVVLINAVNLYDGLDGLVGASTITAGLGLAALAALGGAEPLVGLVLVAATAGFLVLNWHPARVFLGDNGSYTIGVLIAYGILGIGPDGLGPGMAPGLLLAGVFGLDLVATVVRRALAGRPLFAGDRSHLYDQLRDRGWSIPRIALVSAFGQAGFGLAAVGLALADLGPWAWVAVVLVAIAAFSAVAVGGFLQVDQPSAP